MPVKNLSSRRAICTALVAVCALIFPLLHGNDADIDALTNAITYAVLALGLNIVVGFTGLLDLGYAAFFAIGAYAYGILASFQLMPAMERVSGSRSRGSIWFGGWRARMAAAMWCGSR